MLVSATSISCRTRQIELVLELSWKMHGSISRVGFDVLLSDCLTISLIYCGPDSFTAFLSKDQDLRSIDQHE